MKKITLNRNGQTCARDRETSDLKAGQFQVGQHVMLAVRDCDCNRIRGERVDVEYVVAKIVPCDRFGGGRETVTFERVDKEGK